MTITLCSCPSPTLHRSDRCKVDLTKAPAYQGAHRHPDNARRMTPTATIALSMLTRGAR